MNQYNHKQIETKWQEQWENAGLYKNYEQGEKFYSLDMFPYPSGAGLHVGHPRGYIATDVYARFEMLQGKSVLHPMGWDAFGLPAENYAIANKIHPQKAVTANIEVFKNQLKKFGFTYDWDREINTTDPEYYKWTQWIFLQMFNKGLAYQSDEPINWCPQCKTGLALEDLENGLCERCGTQVEQKKLRQWVLKMTDYADRLLADLDKEELDWPESIRQQQKNWIGRSEGVEFELGIRNQESGIRVYTTRIDTVFGMTYAVVAPEHPVIEQIKNEIKNYSEVEQYIIKAQNKTDLERTELQKEKTGVKLEGIEVINPFTGEAIPLFAADYVLGHYGTGAVMAVPAHDERDWEFAKKNNLPIKEVIIDKNKKIVGVGALIKTDNGKFLFQKRDHNTDRNPGMIAPFGGGCKDGESFEFCLQRELKEEIGLDINLNSTYIIGNFESHYAPDTFINIYYISDVSVNGLNINEGDGFVELSLEEAAENSEVTEFTKEIIKYFQEKTNFSFTEDGGLIDSNEYSGLTSAEAREKMADWLESQKIGSRKVNYKMRDWVFSRQRYWGEPIPVVHCDKCGTVGVPEEQLPVMLPEVESYEPTGTGEGPLAKISEWVNTSCPQCGGPAKRETNTMPQWAGSSWYYLRYIDAKNENELVNKDKEKDWMPVDLYVGGAEHATRHLLYARFWHKFLYDLGAVSTKEPFKRLVHVGIVMGEDSRKMSKRWGNVVNPDEVIDVYGADAVRVYEMFMGPFSQMIAWSTDGLKGARRFLDKVWRIAGIRNQESGITNKKINSLLHKIIKKVTEDIENFRFNTAISAMMILVNELEKEKEIPKELFEKFLIILSPFAPHIGEELWAGLGNNESIFKQAWPKYDADLIKEEKINLVVQVNGKMRDTVEVDANITEEDAKAQALASEKLKKWTADKEVVKIIYVPGKLVNIVVR